MPRVSKFLSVIAMSSLSHRLKALQIPSAPEKYNFDHLSLKDLEESTIDFGQTHRGKTYLEMWNRHQDWIGWFVNHYEKSGKENHQKVIHFIQMKIERAELTGEGIPQHAGPKMSHMKPKMKAKAACRKQQMPAEIPIPEMEEEDALFEFLPEAEMDAQSVALTGNVQPLENRVDQMEAVLSRILAHLEHNVESQ